VAAISAAAPASYYYYVQEVVNNGFTHEECIAFHTQEGGADVAGVGCYR